MFKLSRKVEYALMAVTYFKKNNRLISVRDISNELHVPFDTVSKVLQILNNKNIVGAEKGINGGYFLKADLKQINLYDFCYIIEQKEFLRSCNDRPCELMSKCNIYSSINGLNHLVFQFFKQISILDILSNPMDLKVAPITETLTAMDTL